MLSQLKINDDVEITLRDKSTAADHVERIERDGSVKFTKIGFRYRSGMEFHDHPSKKDIVEIKVTGASGRPDDETGPQEITDIEELKRVNATLCEECNTKTAIIDRHGKALSECLAQLSRCLECDQYEAFEMEIDAILNGAKDVVEVVETPKKDAPKSKGKKTAPKKDEGKENEDNTTGEAGNSQETGTADGNE